MAYTHFSGPLITYGYAVSGNTTDPNPVAGPNVAYQGSAILDPRKGYNPGISVNPLSGPATFGAVINGARVCLVNQVPSTISAVNIAASQSPAAGAITLVSATGAGITAGVSITNFAGATVTGLLAIDGAYAPQTVGQAAFLDPTKSIQRAVRLTSGGNDTGITFTVNGYDIYGQPVTSTVTGASGAAATTTKTFKYISSVTASGSVASTLTIGTADVFGFPLRDPLFETVDIFWNSAYITATTGWTAPDATTPATAATGDPRGKYAVQSASDGTKRLVVYLDLLPADVIAATRADASSLYGVTSV